jgi:hypothetical protein
VCFPLKRWSRSLFHEPWHHPACSCGTVARVDSIAQDFFATGLDYGSCFDSFARSIWVLPAYGLHRACSIARRPLVLQFLGRFAHTEDSGPSLTFPLVIFIRIELNQCCQTFIRPTLSFSFYPRKDLFRSLLPSQGFCLLRLLC